MKQVLSHYSLNESFIEVMLRIRKLFSSSLGRNLIYLYLVQGANYLFPLVTLPYLSRVLGPQGFGLLAIGQSLALYLQPLVEYGFALSGTREVARHRGEKEVLTNIFSGVFGARLLLVLPASLLALLALQLPALRQQEKIVFSALFWAIAWGNSPVWFFQGLERMRSVALLEVLTRSLATLGVFLLVREPEEAYLPLFLNGIAASLTSLVGHLWLFREMGFRFPNLKDAFLYLRLGWNLFFFRMAVSLYTVANPLILSFFVTPAQVGLYAGAERLTKALLGMMEPWNRVFLPRFSHLVRSHPAEAYRLASRTILFMFLLGILGALLVVLFAPWAVWLLLGPGYERAVPLMRILSLLLPLIALSFAMGVQWMLAWGMDRAFNGVIVSAGLLNLFLAPFLAHRLGALGMAGAVVLVEAWQLGAILFYLSHTNKLPFGRSRR